MNYEIRFTIRDVPIDDLASLTDTRGSRQRKSRLGAWTPRKPRNRKGKRYYNPNKVQRHSRLSFW